MHPSVPAVLIRLLFYPTLAWNVLLGRVLRVRHWYDRVDDRVLLGALPFASDVERLRAQGVAAVVNTCVEYAGPIAAYEQHGIVQLHVPTLDFTPPSLEDVESALAFMREFVARGDDVYVHCKAGRGRSATIVMCWLMVERGMSPAEAQRHLVAKRPHVNRGLEHRAVVQDLWRRLSGGAVLV